MGEKESGNEDEFSAAQENRSGHRITFLVLTDCDLRGGMDADAKIPH